MSENINFFNEEIEFTLEDSKITQSWIEQVIKNHSFYLSEMNFIFCSDNYLLKINNEHLNHDYYTDIITFDLSEEEGSVESDVFISIDRVKENAMQNKTVFLNELHRVIIHGVLHLIGFNDKTEEEKTIMRKKEDACLSLLHN